MIGRGISERIRSDNDPEMVAKSLRGWLGKLKNELVNGEIVYTPREAQALLEQWRCHNNQTRPISALDTYPWRPEGWGLAPSPPIFIHEPKRAA
jgi:putative transposase